MQASGALRAAAQSSRAAASRRVARTTSRCAATAATSRASSVTVGPLASCSHSPSHTPSSARRQQHLFTTVRMLHRSHMLLQAQKSASPSTKQTSTASTSKSQPTSSTTQPSGSEPSQQIAKTDSTSNEVTDAKPNKTLTERAKELWATAKYLFKFYFNGVKQIWANRTRVQLVRARVADGGAPLSREESQLIHTHQSDMRKLPLFLFILLILEEALPLVVIWAPSLLPSTCILPNQLTKIRMGQEVKRAEAFAQLEQSESLKQLVPVVQESSDGARLTEAHSGEASADVLQKISAEDLTRLAKMFSLSTWGGSSMIRRRLDTHLSYVRQDDELMCVDGYSAIPQHVDALAKACGERGLRCSGIEHREMFDSLRHWLRLTTRNPDTRSISNSSIALLPLQLYNPASLQTVKSELEAESNRGIIDKTKDVLREVVEEEKKVAHRDEQSKIEQQNKKHQQ